MIKVCYVDSFTFQLIIYPIKFFFSEASERQITKKELQREYCLKHSYKTKLVGEDLTFFIVDDENKIIYCTIPKVSSTTWKQVLGVLHGLDKNMKEIHRGDLWRWLHQYTEEERLKRIKTYFKFLFVREPLHRLLSAYKDKFMKRNKFASKDARIQIVKAYRPQDYTHVQYTRSVTGRKRGDDSRRIVTDCRVVTTRHESLPTVIPEAMSRKGIAEVNFR